MHNIPSPSLTRLAATLAVSMDIEAPSQADKPLDALTECLKFLCGGAPRRVLLHNPDALAAHLLRDFPDKYRELRLRTRFAQPFTAVIPSVTPVCFGTMYTGALPEVHGIRSYTKPVITIDTLFDALLRAGKKPAIVAISDSSMSKIFLQRKLDYFFVPDDSAAVETACRLLTEDRHDFIACYTCAFDDVMHRYGIHSPRALEALDGQLAAFSQLYDTAQAVWRGVPSLVGMCTDHGVHDEAPGKGAHGSDMPEDLRIIHFFGGWEA